MRDEHLMKTVEYYSKLNYKTSVYRDDEGDFITEVDDLPGCVAHGATPDEAFKGGVSPRSRS